MLLRYHMQCLGCKPEVAKSKTHTLTSIQSLALGNLFLGELADPDPWKAVP